LIAPKPQLNSERFTPRPVPTLTWERAARIWTPAPWPEAVAQAAQVVPEAQVAPEVQPAGEEVLAGAGRAEVPPEAEAADKPAQFRKALHSDGRATPLPAMVWYSL
jgi:hypothetical protein